MTAKDAPQAEELEVLGAVAGRIEDAAGGVPDPVFAFLLKLTPMLNVDLFVVDDEGRVLLSWRDDAFADGWHVPGGIVRGREEMARRIMLTAEGELGAPVCAEPEPRAILQLFGDRGHFVSFVHRCTIKSVPGPSVRGPGERPTPGDLAWFKSPPRALYPTHHVYPELWEALVAVSPPAQIAMRTVRVAERVQGHRGWTA